MVYPNICIAGWGLAFLGFFRHYIPGTFPLLCNINVPTPSIICKECGIKNIGGGDWRSGCKWKVDLRDSFCYCWDPAKHLRKKIKKYCSVCSFQSVFLSHCNLPWENSVGGMKTSHGRFSIICTKCLVEQDDLRMMSALKQLRELKFIDRE